MQRGVDGGGSVIHAYDCSAQEVLECFNAERVKLFLKVLYLLRAGEAD